jgi:type IV pilus assembly protein PilP
MTAATRNRAKLILPVMALASLTGCIGNDMTDLHNYLAEIKGRPPKNIEPLPQIKHIETFVYDDRGRRNPFSADFGQEEIGEKTTKGTGPQPDLTRRKEELEQFPLDTLRMVGTLEQEKSTWALVKSQDGVIHRVQPGNFMGLNHGQITHIAEEKIELTEIVPSGDGNYQERQATVALGGLEQGNN